MWRPTAAERAVVRLADSRSGCPTANRASGRPERWSPTAFSPARLQSASTWTTPTSSPGPQSRNSCASLPRRALLSPPTERAVGDGRAGETRNAVARPGRCGPSPTAEEQRRRPARQDRHTARGIPLLGEMPFALVVTETLAKRRLQPSSSRTRIARLSFGNAARATRTVSAGISPGSLSCIDTRTHPERQHRSPRPQPGPGRTGAAAFGCAARARRVRLRARANGISVVGRSP